MFLMSTDNTFKKLANKIEQYIKRIIHHDQVVCLLRMQGWINNSKSTKLINYSSILSMKNANNHIIYLVKEYLKI